MPNSDPDEDSCMRAAQAAIEVVREECGDMDMTVRELSGGVFVEMPDTAAEIIDESKTTSGGTVPLDNFSVAVEESEFIQGWIADQASEMGAELVPLGPTEDLDVDHAQKLWSAANLLFGNDLGFPADDLVGSDVGGMLKDEAFVNR